jgi:hypothetical protein
MIKKESRQAHTPLGKHWVAVITLHNTSIGDCIAPVKWGSGMTFLRARRYLGLGPARNHLVPIQLRQVTVNLGRRLGGRHAGSDR